MVPKNGLDEGNIPHTGAGYQNLSCLVRPGWACPAEPAVGGKQTCVHPLCGYAVSSLWSAMKCPIISYEVSMGLE